MSVLPSMSHQVIYSSACNVEEARALQLGLIVDDDVVVFLEAGDPAGFQPVPFLGGEGGLDRLADFIEGLVAGLLPRFHFQDIELGVGFDDFADLAGGQGGNRCL